MVTSISPSRFLFHDWLYSGFRRFFMAKHHLFCHIFPPKLGPKCASSGPLRSWKRWQLVSGRVFGWPLQLGFRWSNTWGMTWGLWNWAYHIEHGDLPKKTAIYHTKTVNFVRNMNQWWSEGTHCVTSTRHFSSMPVVPLGPLWASVAFEVNSPQHSVISGEASNGKKGMDSSWWQMILTLREFKSLLLKMEHF